MKRDFELEFKNLKINETPDLWNRIEAGLSDKKVSPSVSGAAAISVNRYNFGKRTVWRKWGTLAAACLCVALIIPAISLVIGNLGGRRSDYSGASFSPADNGMDNTSDNAPNMTPASESPADEGMAGAAEIAADEGMAEAAEKAESEDMAIGAENSLNRDMAASEDGEGAASKAMADAEAADMDNSKNMTQSSEKESGLDEAVTAGLENGQILNGVVIEVAGVSVSGEEVIYSTVVKQSDEDGFLNVGTELSIACNSDTSYAFPHKVNEKTVLKVGESYTVSLRYDGNSGGAQSAGTSENGSFTAISVENN